MLFSSCRMWAVGAMLSASPLFFSSSVQAQVPQQLQADLVRCEQSGLAAIKARDAAALSAMFAREINPAEIARIFEATGPLQNVRIVKSLLDGMPLGQYSNAQVAVTMPQPPDTYLATFYAADSTKLGHLRIQLSRLNREPCRLRDIRVNHRFERMQPPGN